MLFARGAVLAFRWGGGEEEDTDRGSRGGERLVKEGSSLVTTIIDNNNYNSLLGKNKDHVGFWAALGLGSSYRVLGGTRAYSPVLCCGVWCGDGGSSRRISNYVEFKLGSN